MDFGPPVTMRNLSVACSKLSEKIGHFGLRLPAGKDPDSAAALEEIGSCIGKIQGLLTVINRLTYLVMNNHHRHRRIKGLIAYVGPEFLCGNCGHAAKRHEDRRHFCTECLMAEKPCDEFMLRPEDRERITKGIDSPKSLD
jgi:hypothetical protein